MYVGKRGKYYGGMGRETEAWEWRREAWKGRVERWRLRGSEQEGKQVNHDTDKLTQEEL